MTGLDIHDVPELKLEQDSHHAEGRVPGTAHTFCYDLSGHEDLPHVIKFSGGRTSGMMLFVLLEAGLFKAGRGDVVVFNNTSAEHPATYEFVRHCKEIVENTYGIPFFLIEFQTHEDARSGEWTRLPTYRLVQPVPRSEANPDGYHWQGEVFEELLSWTGYAPNQFKRTCTSNLKLEPTRAFLKDWLACKQQTERLGHFGKSSRLDDDDMYESHIRHSGGVPRNIFLKKKQFVRSRPVFRPAQRFTDYSATPCSITNPYLEGKSLGHKACFGPDGVEYLAFVGLRHDEMRRVVRVRQRNNSGPHAAGHEGEHMYLPLSDMGVTQEDVEEFWKKQAWNLTLDVEDGLSNCTYCFLKGIRGLRKARTALGRSFDERFKETPCDLAWWVGIEQKYGRDLEAEQRDIRSKVVNNFIGFFGTQSGFSYKRLTELPDDETAESLYADSVLPCDCTD